MTVQHSFAKFRRAAGALIPLALAVFFLAACNSSTGSTAGGATATPGPLPYAADLQGAVIDPPRTITGFDLPSTTGSDFNLADYHGQIVLAYFGYRSCPDFCPTTFAEMRRISDELGDRASRVKVVFITVDPERDDLENLGLYVHNFNPDYIGVRSEGPTLQNLMNQFGVVAQRRQVGESALSYLIDHTASVFLIGPDGRLQVQYLYGTDYRILVHDIRLILDQT